ncbi:MAG: TVP38/TMEM64 family protein [Bradymonadaceae bacterium]
MSDRTFKILRFVALVLLVAGLFFAGTRPAVQAFFDLEYLRETTADAGFLGIVSFLGIWIVACLMQVPGAVFVVAALLGWGTVAGSLIAFVGLTVTTSASFWTLRGVGGSPVADLDYDWVRQMLDRLDDKPIRTVALLRVFFLVNPVVNTSLVLTEVRFRDYLLGSMAGFVIPLGVIAATTRSVAVLAAA